MKDEKEFDDLDFDNPDFDVLEVWKHGERIDLDEFDVIYQGDEEDDVSHSQDS